MSKKQLSKEEVIHIAKLAKLKLTDAEIEKFQKQMSDILEYVDKLNEVDTTSIAPTSQVTGLTNVFRKDEISESLSQKDALLNAPEHYNGYFKVKPVF